MTTPITTPTELDPPDPSPTVLALAQALAERDGQGAAFTSTTRSETSAETASKYIREAQDIAAHLPAPTVKPGREEAVREIDRAIGNWEASVVTGTLPEALADAVLAILPGKTIAQVRAEALREAADALEIMRAARRQGRPSLPTPIAVWIRNRADEEAGR